MDQVEADWVDGRWANTEVGPFSYSTSHATGAGGQGHRDQGGRQGSGHGLLQHRTAWVQRSLDQGFLNMKANRYGLTAAGPEGHDFCQRQRGRLGAWFGLE